MPAPSRRLSRTRLRTPASLRRTWSPRPSTAWTRRWSSFASTSPTTRSPPLRQPSRNRPSPSPASTSSARVWLTRSSSRPRTSVRFAARHPPPGAACPSRVGPVTCPSADRRFRPPSPRGCRARHQVLERVRARAPRAPVRGRRCVGPADQERRVRLRRPLVARLDGRLRLRHKPHRKPHFTVESKLPPRTLLTPPSGLSLRSCRRRASRGSTRACRRCRSSST